MKINIKKALASLAVLLVASAHLSAQTTKPTITKFSYTDNSIVESMSDNGLWALAQPGYSDDQKSGRAKLIYIPTNTVTQIQTEDDVTANGTCVVADVTDDGNIVVGAYKGKPAYWNKTTGEWTILPSSKGGDLSAVTPDGKYAVGTLTISGEYYLRGALYDLTTNTEVELTNLPTKDMAHEVQQQAMFTAISADGRYILASMSPSYLQPLAVCCYIYDVQEQKATFIGFTPDDTKDWTPADADLYFVEGNDACMSNNGKWVTGGAYTTSDTYVPYLYNVETNEFTLYNESTDAGMIGYAVDNNGVAYTGTPVSTPLREWSLRYGNYWYNISDIFTQHYGIDFYDLTRYENTGYPTAVSDDGKTFVCTPDPNGESYVVTFPETLTEACGQIDLLGTYTVSPAEGTAFAKMRKVILTFTRDLELVGNYKNVSLQDENGNVIVNPLSGGGVSVSGKTLTLTFRPSKAVMEAGKKYKIVINAGTITLKGDKTMSNKEITLTYEGRDNVAVAPTNIYPSNEAEVSGLDYNSNPVIITFDSYIAKTDSASASLVNKNDGTKVCDLNLAVSDNKLGVYPTSKQYLYLGTDYQVVVGAGSVTDVQGYGANEAITIDYTGVYEREISSDDATLFSDDFSNTSQSWVNFMRYEGDHNTPTSAMQAWTFDADNQPWNFTIRESSSSTDNCAASHSMYSPAGKSDDWMVIPQLAIPDAYCTLSFKAQSYLKSKNDTLKVIVWQSDENVNVLTASTIEKIKSEGEVVFCEQLSPGATEEGLSDEWTDYTVDLGKYDGKNIYIAFLNDNYDQSAIFVDDIKVIRNLKYLLSLSNAESVVNQESIDVAGTLTANSEFDTFTSVKLTLCGTDGSEIDTFEKTGLSLTKGDKVEFSFSKPLPLTVGTSNKFSINVKLDSYEDVKRATVKDLTFKPNRKVVLEEFTGTTCPNCPRGIVAIEHLRDTYGDNFIPVSLHTYDGDSYGSGLSGYSSGLGLNAAPSGIVDRNGVIASPMWSNPLTGYLSFNDLKSQSCWADYVESELNTPADAEITVDKVEINETANTFTLPVSVRYALTAKNLSLNVFVTVLEDGIIANQENNCGSTDDPLLGDWGKGGKYSATNNYNIRHDDVVRAYYSESVEGTSGYLPNMMNAGEAYTFSFEGSIPASIGVRDNAKAVIMLLDANTGKVINADVAKFDGSQSGISKVNANSDMTVRVDGGNVTVLTSGAAEVSVYSVAGTLLGNAKGNGTAVVSVGNYKGTAMVKAITSTGVAVKKVVIK